MMVLLPASGFGTLMVLWEAVKNGILTVRLTVVRGRVSPLGPDREQM